MARGLVILTLAACTKTASDDAPQIRAILEAEARLDRALKEADDERDGARAATLLETRAMPAADDAIAIANAQAPPTEWGKGEKDALVSLLRDRKASIPEYASALRGDDLEVKLAALEKQRDLEKRAKAVTSHASLVP